VRRAPGRPAPPDDVAGPSSTRWIQGEVEEQTAVGRVFLAALLRRQLRLSLIVAGLLLALLLSQPLVAWVVPAYSAVRVFGIPLPWVVLGALTYPLMIVLGLVYVRGAENTDDDFTDLLR
jgi:uncharacterized membrane protein (DUF485 family)